MDNHKPHPIFNRRIFWDVNFDTLDYDLRACFIIERVFERGDVEDIRNCRRYYGDEKVAEALLNAKYMALHIIYLAAAVINRPITDFRSYKNRQSHPDQWHPQHPPHFMIPFKIYTTPLR